MVAVGGMGRFWFGRADYESLQNITRRPGTTPGTYSSTRLDSQLGFAIVQDIDGDGLLELLICSSAGNRLCFRYYGSCART